MAAEHHTVRRLERGALEFVRSGSVLALLLADGCDRELHRSRTCLVERRLVARTRPIFVGQAHRITERVDSPRSEEHTSEIQSIMRISYAVFCLKKKKINN